MCKVLLINGSPHEHGCTYTALHEVEIKLNEHQIATEVLYLGAKPISDCINCGKCLKTGHCFIMDKVNEILNRLNEFDAIVLGSPVYYAGPTGSLCSFLDRLFYCGEVAMAGKFGAAVVCCHRGGATAALDRLNKYFTISNMPVVPSQFWNLIHGHTPEDVSNDALGMQTMRTLGENMAWLLKIKEAGKATGVSAPNYESGFCNNTQQNS
jgi:multimeric flavodoxin WrbA